MKRIAFLVALAISATTLAAGSANAGDDWKSPFDGKTLKGWTQKNGIAKYEVVDGTIHGTTVEGSPNSFLCSDKEYGNFELEFEVKVHNSLNSGCQIRSKTKETDGRKKNDKFGRVYGPQCEIEASGANGAEAGYIYGEATETVSPDGVKKRGWRTPKERLKPHKVMQDGEWNKFRIVANGPRIQTWINGKAIEDLTDEEIFKTHPKGFIGLQVHGIKAGTGPYDVAWKNIRIKELK